MGESLFLLILFFKLEATPPPEREAGGQCGRPVHRSSHTLEIHGYRREGWLGASPDTGSLCGCGRRVGKSSCIGLGTMKPGSCCRRGSDEREGAGEDDRRSCWKENGESRGCGAPGPDFDLDIFTHYTTLDALLSLPECPSFICEMGTIILLPVMCGDELKSLTESA